jgi:predicted sugar kinase
MMHIVARPRLHLALADMAYASSRVFGGIGFSIDFPLTVFRLEKSNRFELRGLEILDDEGGADRKHRQAGKVQRPKSEYDNLACFPCT